MSGSADGLVKIFESATGKEVKIFHGHAKAINSVVYSKDGRVIASGSSDYTIRIWDANPFDEVKSTQAFLMSSPPPEMRPHTLSNTNLQLFQTQPRP